MKNDSNNPINSALQALALENSIEYRFEKEQICQIHDQMIELYGGQLGIRDNNLLESVVSAPYQEYFGEVLYPTVFDKAAKYLFDFANYQIFYDGNKRTGLGVCQAFLYEHGFAFKEDFDTKAYILVLDIANHKYNEPEEIIDIIKDNVVIIPEKMQELLNRDEDVSCSFTNDIKQEGGSGVKNYTGLMNDMSTVAKELSDSIESGPDI